MDTPYSATATLDGGAAFRVRMSSGHEIVLDSSPENGGEERGARPMEMVLTALAGCTGMDVISMLRKMRQDVTGYAVHVVGAERAADYPRIFTRITVEHVVRGRGLNAADVARAVELSATKYCPVSGMLDKAAEVTHTYRIVEDVTAPAR